MALYPNQRPNPRALDNAKRLNDQVLRDQRLDKARDSARKLRRAVDDAWRRLRAIVEKLDHGEHASHSDHRSMESLEQIDNLVQQLRKLNEETHASIVKSPASHLPEFVQKGDGGEAALFQIVGALLILLMRIKQLRLHGKVPEGRRAADEAKRLLRGVSDLARRS